MKTYSPNPPTKQKHTKSWFINRIGSYIIKDSKTDIFNNPILIMSAKHAEALYLTQTANHTYTT
jgi:hypothetical protein